MKNSQDTLRRELRSSGASVVESDELLHLAGRLSSLRAVPRTTALQSRKRAFAYRLLPTSAVAVLALLVGMSTVAFAQNSLPGNWLYPVKRLSENTAVAVHPDYRATLMMRRADEVRQLVADNASTSRVKATLADYQVQAKAYTATNYPAFDYCKSNLHQAEQTANSSEKQMIASVLKNLGDIE